jgi:hypothetical protein
VREDDGVVVLFQAIHVFWHGCVPPFSIALEGPVVMGSGFRRNDGGTPHNILHKYQADTASPWPLPGDVVSRQSLFDRQI